MCYFKYYISATALSMCYLSFTQPVNAQEIQSEKDSVSNIQDIIVTAQRRSESIQKVPMSVSVLTSEALQERHFTDPSQLQFIAPNLQFTSFAAAPGATNFSVRGIGTSSFSHLIEPSVATVIDGVVLGRPEMGVMQFADLDRIEVLAGPQGMLFGKNASAGLINIVTTRPKLGATEVIAHAELGTVNAAKECCTAVVQGTVNTPLGSNAALRVNGYYTNYPGLVRDVVPNPNKSNYGHSEYGGKVKLLWEPTDALSIYIAADYAHGIGLGAGAVTPRRTAPGSALIPQEQAAGITPGPNNLFRSSLAVNDVTFDVGGVQGEIAYEFGNGVTISNILAYRKYKANHSFDGDAHQFSYFDHAAASFDFDQLTEELRISSPTGSRLEYQAGLFFYAGQTDRVDDLQAQLGLGQPPAGSIAWAGVNSLDALRSRSYAIYGQATYRLTDSFRVTAGGRYTWDRLRDVAHADHIGFVFPFTPDTDAVKRIRTKDFSWRVSAQYDVAANVMAYATVSTGYKGPGFNQVYGGGLAIGPEHSTAYEVGVKSRLGGNVLFNVSAYWETVRDLQIQTFLPEIPAYLTSNAGSLRARGVEAELRWGATPDLTFSTNVSFSDAVFTDFRRAQCYPGQSVAEGCVAAPADPTNFFTDATGNRLQNAPKWSGTAAVDYEHAFSAKLSAFFHADVYGRTSVNFNANGNPFTTQEGYVLVNTSLGIGPQDRVWKIGVFCRNCFDKRFTTFIDANPGGALGDYSQAFGLTSFRTIGLSLDMRF